MMKFAASSLVSLVHPGCRRIYPFGTLFNLPAAFGELF